MKKTIIMLVMCFMSALASAKVSLPEGKPEFKLIHQSKQITYLAACTQTRSTVVYVNGMYAGTFTETRTFSSDDPSFNCSIAGAMAQSAADAAARAWAEGQGYTEIN